MVNMEKNITPTKDQHVGIVIVTMLAFWHKLKAPLFIATYETQLSDTQLHSC